jgi:P4 family phage/plasmid primase-like protien
LAAIERATSHAPVKRGQGFVAHCPAHDDRNPSLSISEGKGGRVLVKCFAGCTFSAIAAALGLQARDFFTPKDRRSRATRRRRIVATYDYLDEGGSRLFQVVRYLPKDFRARRPGPNHTWIWNLRGIRRVLFRLPEVRRAVRNSAVIFICEGERDVLALVGLGCVATSNPGGAGKWQDTYSDELRGATVVIIADKDDPGRKHAQQVAASLHGKAASVKVVELPDRDGHPVKDASDWIAAGGDKLALEKIVADTPLWNPESARSPAPTETPTSEQESDIEKRFGRAVLSIDKECPVALNQQHLVGLYAKERGIIYEPGPDTFYEYDPSTGLWKPKTDKRVQVEIGHRVKAIAEEYGAPNVLAGRTQGLLSQLVSLLKGEAEHADFFAEKPPFIHVANGMLDLSVDPPVLRECGPEYLSRNRTEIVLDVRAECPRFRTELLDLALDADDQLLLQKYAGQCLLGRNPSQRILLLRGVAGGSKSTLAEIVERIVGVHNVCQLRVHLLEERFEIASFVGRTLLAGKDVPGSFLDSRATYVLKALVGGDLLHAEQKNSRHRFDVRGDFNVIITSNSRLRVRLDSDVAAWRRRLLIIDFSRPPVPKPIPYFARTLVEEEGPGLLNWAIEGAVLLLRDIEEHGGVQVTEQQRQRVDDLLSESDSVRKFVAESVRAAPGQDVTVVELCEAYTDFCDQRGWEPLPIHRLEAKLADAMLEAHRSARRNDIKRAGKNVRGFGGVALPMEAST